MTPKEEYKTEKLEVFREKFGITNRKQEIPAKTFELYGEIESFLSQMIDELWAKEGSDITPLLEARKNLTDRIADLNIDYFGAGKVLKEMNEQIELIDKNIDKLIGEKMSA